MKIRAIKTIDELHTAMQFMRSLNDFPPRAENYYLPRFKREAPLFVIGEDDAGIRAVVFGSVVEGNAVQVDDYIPEDVASVSLRARFLEAISKGADTLHLGSLFIPAHIEAEAYEEIGCVPKMHIQIFGKHKEKTRRDLIRRLRGTHRVLSTGTHGLAVYAQFRTDQVDQSLIREIEATTPGALGAIWLMGHWVGEESDLLSNGTIHYRHPQYFVTHYPRFRRTALEEVCEVDPATTEQSRPAPDVAMIPSTKPGYDLVSAFRAQPPVFVRHLAPIQLVVPLKGTQDDLGMLATESQRLTVDASRSFAVQCRKGPITVAGPHETAAYTSRDVEIKIGSQFTAPFDPERPEQVLSVFIDGSLAYLGLSDSTDNLVTHADEARRRSAKPTRICRAEHKLQEAIEVFKLHLVPGQRALDLGAAPGGWTMVLAEAGLEVTAIDPAELSPEVCMHPRVEHIRSKAECAMLAGRHFDLVVNDMAIDPDESAGILCDIAPALAAGTQAVMTIKLPTLNVRRWLPKTMEIVETAFEVEAIRHLFHNRQEVTALLRRRVGR